MRVRARYRVSAFKDGGAIDGATDALAPQTGALIDPQPTPPTPSVEDAVFAEVEKTSLPPLAKQWLREHPVFLTDFDSNMRLQNLHHELVDEGYAEYSPEYFKEAEYRLAQPPMAKQIVETPRREPATPRAALVSAPVSREPVFSDGSRREGTSIRLTAQELEHARVAGVSASEYARQKLELLRRKQQGDYGSI